MHFQIKQILVRNKQYRLLMLQLILDTLRITNYTSLPERKREPGRFGLADTGELPFNLTVRMLWMLNIKMINVKKGTFVQSVHNLFVEQFREQL